MFYHCFAPLLCMSTNLFNAAPSKLIGGAFCACDVCGTRCADVQYSCLLCHKPRLSLTAACVRPGRIREIIPPAAWHSLQPAALREAALAVARGETEAGPAADLPPYVRSRLRLLLAEGLDKSVRHRHEPCNPADSTCWHGSRNCVVFLC